MGVDFSSFLDLSTKPKIEITPLDKSKFKKHKSGGVKFNYCIGIEGEDSALTAVKVKETYFNPNDYIITEDDLWVAAMYGGPLY